MTVTFVYKIRDKKTGLFSSGSKNGYVSWTKNGKSWSQLGHVKSSITQFTYSYKTYPYDNAELITYRIEEAEVVDINELIKIK